MAMARNSKQLMIEEESFACITTATDFFLNAANLPMYALYARETAPKASIKVSHQSHLGPHLIFVSPNLNTCYLTQNVMQWKHILGKNFDSNVIVHGITNVS